MPCIFLLRQYGCRSLGTPTRPAFICEQERGPSKCLSFYLWGIWTCTEDIISILCRKWTQPTKADMHDMVPQFLRSFLNHGSNEPTAQKFFKCELTSLNTMRLSVNYNQEQIPVKNTSGIRKRILVITQTEEQGTRQPHKKSWRQKTNFLRAHSSVHITMNNTEQKLANCDKQDLCQKHRPTMNLFGLNISNRVSYLW